MKALLINPEWPDTYWSFRHALAFQGKRCAYPPLGLLTVAAMLPASWEKRVVDVNVRPLLESDLQWADVAMLTGMLVHKDSIREILGRCRARGLRTVLGGPLASSLEDIEDIRRLVDHVVIGEAEELMPQLAADLEAGSAAPAYRAPSMPDLSKAPVPDLSLINLKHYSAMSVQFSRGCPFNCEFCDIIEMYGRKPRTKSPGQIVQELEQLYRLGWRGSVFLVDDNFIGNKKKVKELLPVMEQWNRAHRNPFTFFTEASLNLADDAGLLQSMRAAGFSRVFLGIETPAEESLKEAQKLQNTHRSMLDSVHRIQSFGMEVMAGFIVGFDNDPEDIFERQVEFITESAIPMAMVGLLQALPNTQLYRRLAREGRLLHASSGDNLDADLNFVPRMDPRRLVDGYRSILKRIYEPSAYYDRVRRFLAHYQPVACSRRRSWADYRAFLQSLTRQGIFEKQRWTYWKFLFDAATRYRHAFSTAVTLAIMGYHFQKITQRVCQE